MQRDVVTVRLRDSISRVRCSRGPIFNSNNELSPNTERDVRRPFSCGAIVVVTSPTEGAGKVLIIKQEQSGYWGFPKGHRNRGESEEETAKRELREETSIELDPKLFTDALRIKTSRYVYFLIEIESDVLPNVVIDNDEINAFEWVNISNCMSPFDINRAYSRQTILAWNIAREHLSKYTMYIPICRSKLSSQLMLETVSGGIKCIIRRYTPSHKDYVENFEFAKFVLKSKVIESGNIVFVWLELDSSIMQSRTIDYSKYTWGDAIDILPLYDGEKLRQINYGISYF